MPINPAIAMGFQTPQLQNPLDAYSKGMQIQAAQNQNALAQYQLSTAQRNDETQANFLAQLRAANGDQSKIDAAYMGAGKGKELGDMRHLAAQTGNLDAKTGETKVKTQKDIQDFLNQGKRDLTANPSDANVTAWTEDAVLKGFMPPDRAQASLEHMLSMSPEDRITHLSKSGASSKELTDLAQPNMLNTQSGFTPTDKLTGLPTGAPVIPIEQSANNLATNTSREQIAVAARMQAQQHFNATPTLTTVVNPDDPARTQVIDARSGRVIGTGPKEPGVGIQLPQKEVQKREAAYPKATAAISDVEDKSDKLVTELDRLIEHPGLSGMTGLISGRTPNITGPARQAQAIYDNIVSRGVVNVIAGLKQMSATGSTGFGQLSNQEGQMLKSTLGALSTTQDTKDVITGLKTLRDDVVGAKNRARQAYDSTYEYRTGVRPSPASATPVASGVWGKAVPE